jgi:amino acid permease
MIKKSGPMTKAQNKVITLGIVFTCYILAVCIPDVGAVISIAGATVNPFIGFLFPIIFYLKLKPKRNSVKDLIEEAFAYFVIIIISVVSIAGFIALFK